MLRYRQFWSQLEILGRIFCRHYQPDPTMDSVTVPVLPVSLHQEALFQAHDAPSAGHQGTAKTLHRLRQESYWVGMAWDVERHCQECVTCQQTKPPLPKKAPLMSMPVGRPWQLVAVDILKVPLSMANNQYLLIVQDYFTKWAEAIPLPDQTAPWITAELVEIFSVFWAARCPTLRPGAQFWKHYFEADTGSIRYCQIPYNSLPPTGDGMVERLNRSLLQMLCAFVE